MARAAAKRKTADTPVIKFTADEIVLRKVEELVVFPNNPKLHSTEQIAKIAENILEYGFDQPILIDEKDTILKGHGRQLAARKAGLALVPTIVRKGLSLAQKWAIVISDNALPAMTGFDKGLLKIGLTTLAKLDYPLHLTGFDNVRLATFGVGEAAGHSDPDEEVEPESVVVSKLGDVWLMGEHRICCGDSTKKEDVATVLGKDKPHLMVTDPPYGVDYDATWRGKAGHANLGKNRTGVVLSDNRFDWTDSWKLFFGDVAYVWHGHLHAGPVGNSLIAAGLELRMPIVWNKTVMAMGRGDYHWKHEACWYAVRKGHNGHWTGDRTQTSVWDIASPLHIMSGSKETKTEHPTQKPVECMKRPIENNSKQGDYVYEPFAGSGTTIIAAEMTGRICLAIELSPAYVDLCVRRWCKFAGKKAILQGTKKTFDHIQKERSKAAA